MRRALNELVLGRDPWPLFMWGPVGTGKTLAALCLCDAVGGGCLYLTAGELADRVMRANKGELTDEVTGNRITADRFWAEWHSARLCVLDELGARDKVSDWHYECVKRAIDLRETRPLICISNLQVDDLEALYDERVVSRLASGTVLEVDGPDRRIRGVA